MTVIMNDPSCNDYDVTCNICGTDDLCEHDFPNKPFGCDVSYCEDHCPKCEKIVAAGRENTQGLIEKDLLL